MAILLAVSSVFRLAANTRKPRNRGRLCHRRLRSYGTAFPELRPCPSSRTTLSNRCVVLVTPGIGDILERQEPVRGGERDVVHLLAARRSCIEVVTGGLQFLTRIWSRSAMGHWRTCWAERKSESVPLFPSEADIARRGYRRPLGARIFKRGSGMSALPPNADMFSVETDVCFVP